MDGTKHKVKKRFAKNTATQTRCIWNRRVKEEIISICTQKTINFLIILYTMKKSPKEQSRLTPKPVGWWKTIKARRRWRVSKQDSHLIGNVLLAKKITSKKLNFHIKEIRAWLIKVIYHFKMMRKKSLCPSTKSANLLLRSSFCSLCCRFLWDASEIECFVSQCWWHQNIYRVAETIYHVREAQQQSISYETRDCSNIVTSMSSLFAFYMAQ